MNYLEDLEFPNWGINHLNLIEASKLACKCMLCQGYLEVSENIEVVSLHDKKIEELLEADIKKMLLRLIKAVDEGTLKASVIRREMDEKIIAEETYVLDEDLAKWFYERNMDLGDLYYDDYRHLTYDMYSAAQEAIALCVLKRQNPEIQKSEDSDEVFHLRLEILELQQQLYASTNVPMPKTLHPKSRTSLLKMVFAMAVAKYRYDPRKAKNSATANIASQIRELGMNLDEDTVSKWLSEASSVLEGEYVLKPK